MGSKDTRATTALQDKVISTEVTMGIFAFRDDNITSTLISNPYTFKFDTEGNFSHSGEKILYYPSQTTVGLNLYSYIPYDATYTEFNGSYDFTVQSDQIEDLNYLSSDLLYGTFTSARADNVANINYTHKLSRLDFTLNLGDGIDMADMYGAVVSLVGINCTVTFKPSDGSISAASGAATDIPFLKIQTGATATSYTASVRFPPQTLEKGDFIKITLRDGTVITKTLESDFTTAENKYYTSSYTLTATEVKGSSASVKKFDEVNITGSATEQ